jgi:hypothetical protein
VMSQSTHQQRMCWRVSQTVVSRPERRRWCRLAAAALAAS